MPPVEIRTTQTILSLDAVGSDRAALWFPELVEIGATGERPVFFDGPSPCPVWKPQGESALGYRLEIPGRLAIGANIQPHPLGFDLSLELTNKSPGDWKQVIAAVCLQLTPAASFLDLTRERTGCVSGGRVRSFAEMKTIGGRPVYLFSFVRDHTPQKLHGDPTQPEPSGATRSSARMTDSCGCAPPAPTERSGWDGTTANSFRATSPRPTAVSTPIPSLAICRPENASEGAAGSVSWKVVRKKPTELFRENSAGSPPKSPLPLCAQRD